MEKNNNINDETIDQNSIQKSINRTKLKFYSNKPILVHIKLKNGTFRNCYIKAEHSHEVWLVDERKLGETNLFEDEIKSIEDYVSKPKENEE
jgi:hypothetical protein